MHILRNFKNFSHAELDLTRPMNLLIGRNGSGKSNVIEGVELLAQLAHGRPLYEITDIGRGGGTGFEIRGGLAGCPKNDQSIPKSNSELNGHFLLEFNGVWKSEKFSYFVLVTLMPQPQIYSECLAWGGRIIFEAALSQRKDIIQVLYDNHCEGEVETIVQLPSDRSVLSRYESFANLESSDQKYKDSLALVRYVEKHLNSAFVFDINPKLMRGYERIGQPILAKNGANLSSVLYGLSQGDKNNRPVLSRILERIKQLPDEQFVDFEFITTRLNDVIFALKHSDGSLVDARLLSDGTLRALAILTALETVPEHSRIIIEEMDNGIHPSRVKLLVDAIWEASHRRNLNVLVTTHNPATLDSLSAEQLESVVLCYHDNEQNTSKLTPLLDLPRADVLLERGRLGDLVTRRVIEQHLAPDFDEEQKRKAKAWLESLA